MPTPKHDIVVGVDFGTTAFVFLLILKNPNLQENQWGFLAQKEPNMISWFKLFLDDDLEIEIESWKAEVMGWAGSRGIMSLPRGKSSIDTISDYLGALRAKIWDHLKEKCTNAEKSLETSTIKFCFTIPGHWSTEARSRKCDDVCLLIEADAAIIFALSTLQDNAGTLPLKGDAKVDTLSADLLKLFQPSVRTIVNYLNSHMSEANSMKGEAPAIKKILLVGGFSLSRFLQSEIIRAFPDMTIITDRQNALTAVVQGAIAWGSGKVELQSMRSPCHFGFSTVNPVDFSLPINSCLGSAFQNGSIDWLVKKISTLAIDISGIDFSHSERCEGGGPSAWKVNYMISACLGDTNGTIHFDVYWERIHLMNWKFKPGFIRL
ncbi:uncharacterized protein N7483_001030 [Penicillium malachiteum]|uniref:uncharacterized protein n=1 Tax=Penicillium malachiteum TaxID=1324776 RepID=UPI00254819AC|nr:uncharacterized protein N7483_001030 [Penicillium malachiteum]KAJ5735905.1 hypothetical protein N7483_001030 [Penicillium malachiteum]